LHKPTCNQRKARQVRVLKEKLQVTSFFSLNV
jgi:hypothetical protein